MEAIVKRGICTLLMIMILISGCAAPMEEPIVAPGKIDTQDQTRQPDQNREEEQSSTQNEDPADTESEIPIYEEEKEEAPPWENTFVAGGEGAGVEISCMSFNVLSWDTHQIGYEEPAVRAPLVVDFILEQDCDIVGLQEVSEAHGYNWVATLSNGLSHRYNIRILTQEEDSACTTMNISAGLMILYRKDRFEFLDSGCYEYYEDCTRYYQWVKLKDKKSNRELYVTNTHWSINPDWDPTYGDVQRCDEARELANFWETVVKDTPLFATGDYNSGEYDNPHITQLQDSEVFWPASMIAEQLDGVSSIDMVYINNRSMKALRHVLLDRGYKTKDGDMIDMSDHCPVIAYASYR